jgi:S1-C subfamily serine protease
VLIVDVAKNSPAAQAGFQAGDIILAVGDRQVQTAAEVQEQVEASQIGQPLDVQIKRAQREKVIAVSPGAFPQ